MRTAHTVLFFACLGVCPFASADELWNNYVLPNGWDGVTGLSSERATVISDTWVVDDAVFGTPVIVEQIQWIGFQDLVAPGFSGADYIIMDSQFNVVVEVNDFAYEQTLLGQVFTTLDVYEGTIKVDPVSLDPGQYYFGVRLVGNNLGRNFAATSFSGAGLIRGYTEAYFRGVSFGFSDWTPVSGVLSSALPSDFAYRINGKIVPAPAGLILLPLGAAAAFRRRR